ncbi:MAG: hypothetical protein D8G53_07390 [Candidatus Saccharimonas sp.]|nr:MAG: hypothetical protein D8G53_07390 [Candidatus Saccharimonas sp.]
MNNSDKKQTFGFSLALTMLMSVVVLTVLFGVYRVVIALYVNTQESYYLKLAEEAGEAGAAYANACLDINRHLQSWSSSHPLTPDSDCRGTTGIYPANKFVFNDGHVRTAFTVGILDYNYKNSAQISAIGKAELISGGSVLRDYTVTIKKAVTWPMDGIPKKIMSGNYRTCTIISDDIWCWGANRYGQLGNGKSFGSGDVDTPLPYIDSPIPVRVRKDPGVLAGKKIDDLFTAQYHSCALAEGKVYCWGYNPFGGLGIGPVSSPGVHSTAHSNVPVEVKGALLGKTVTAIGGTGNTSCAIAEGKIYCWGFNQRGSVGANSGQIMFDTPVQVASGLPGGLPVGYTATALSSSGSRSYNMCAIADAKAYCWGPNDAGQTGRGITSSYVTYPTAVGGLDGISVLSITQDGWSQWGGNPPNYTHICALTSEGPYCWGSNYYGQIGDGVAGGPLVTVPKKVKLPAGVSKSDVKDIQAGLYHTCMLTSAGKVYCWGRSNKGQVGNGAFTSVNDGIPNPTPVVTGSNGIPAGEVVEKLGAGANRGCATVSNDRTYCWGNNSNGQIGDNTHVNRANPTESLFLRPAKNRYIY